MSEHEGTTPQPLRDHLRRLILLAPWALAACADPYGPQTPPEASASAAIQPAAKPVKPSRLPVIESVFSDEDVGYVIDGAPVTYQVTLRNDGSSASGIGVRAEIVQGANRSPAGSQPASCSGTPGVVPTGTCAMDATAVATNTGASPAPLTIGPATLVVTLVQSNGAGKPKVLDTRSVAIEIYAPSRTITSLVMSPAVLTLGGSSVPYTATVVNDGPTLSEVYIQGLIRQGSLYEGAGGTLIRCGSLTPGALPTGTCSFSFTAVAPINPFPEFRLQPGAAMFELTLYRVVNGVSEVLDVKSVDVTLATSP